MAMSGVRNKIASFEAQSRKVRTPSPSPSRHEVGEMSPARSASTAMASQNRISRMKQEHMTKDGKTIVDKRKLLKERRMLQQKRASTPEDHPPHSVESRVSLARRTEYIPDRQPVEESFTVKKEPSMQAMSPGRNSRFSKVQQRMQKMKGLDQSKKAETSRPSLAPSMAESTATTAVAQNSMTTNPLQRRPRQGTSSLMQSRAKRVSEIKQSRNMLRTQEGGSSAEKTNSMAEAGSPPRRSRHQRKIPSSPISDVDVFSENNYGFGTTDQSVEATDDEATLTSVRRIMAGENNGHPSPREKSVHYHHLQPFEDSNRSGRTAQQSSSHPRSTHSKTSRLHHGDRLDNWPQEEKSDKAAMPRVFRTESSSDYDTDADMSKGSLQSQILEGPSNSQVTDVNEFFTQSKYPQPNRRMDDDERTFDYGDRDEDSNASGSYAMRRRRAIDAPVEAPSNEWKEEAADVEPSSLINKDDVEHYTKSFGSPGMKMGVGVIGAVTVGCMVLGPAGLLAGVAVVGLGLGAMQIPEKEREKIQAKVEKTVRKVHAKALDATESLSNSCATTYEEYGMAEHLPPCLSLATEQGNKEHESTRSDKRIPGKAHDESKTQSKNGPKQAGAPPLAQEANHPRLEHENNVDRPRNKKVACLRNVRILPPGQIHGLDPAAQPKAWLDVVASAHTSEDEKAEAMEEILILAKDKRRARIFLEEGILDSLVWTLDRYFEKQQARERGMMNIVISKEDIRAVKLAATCCVTLGKAHCAAIHTEGDLQLMSLYERGSVPEERQVAQMLYETPHHVRITKVTDPTFIDPGKEVFALRQLSLQQAEDLARSIKAVVDGQL